MKLSKTSAAIAVAMLAACSSGSTDQGTNPTIPQEVTPPGAPFTCTPVELNVGEVRTSLSGTNVCITANAASEFVVNGFFASTTGSANASVNVTGFGITTGSSVGGASTSEAPATTTSLDGLTPRQ